MKVHEDLTGNDEQEEESRLWCLCSEWVRDFLEFGTVMAVCCLVWEKADISQGGCQETVREMRSGRSSRRSGRSCQTGWGSPYQRAVTKNKEIDERENRRAPVFLMIDLHI